MNWSPEEKSFVERAVAWTAISYAFGFFIVLLHTSRLGLPILELVRPIFVWIGIPLALLIFFSARLARLIQARMVVARAATALYFKEIPEASVVSAYRDSSPQVVVDRMAREAAQAMPILMPRRIMVYLFKVALGKIVADLPSTPEAEAELAKAGERTIRMLRAFTAGKRFFSAVIVVAAIVAGVMAYVWYVYPRIPQPMGGGAPMWVRLSVKADAAPESVRAELQRSTISSDAKAPFLTDSVQLIYNAKDAAYLRLRGGRTISLAHGGIVGIVWH